MKHQIPKLKKGWRSVLACQLYICMRRKTLWTKLQQRYRLPFVVITPWNWRKPSSTVIFSISNVKTFFTYNHWLTITMDSNFNIRAFMYFAFWSAIYLNVLTKYIAIYIFYLWIFINEIFRREEIVRTILQPNTFSKIVKIVNRIPNICSYMVTSLAEGDLFNPDLCLISQG